MSSSSNGAASLAAEPFATTSSAKSSSIFVFGFPSSALQLVLSHFAQFGEIVSSTPSTEGGNWITITYQDSWSASRALRKNGEVLGGMLMVGVKAVDEDALGRASPRPAPAQQPQLSRAPSSNTPSGVGRPVPVVSAGSAFKQPAAHPSRLGFFSAGSASNGTPQTSDPHASLFAEKNRQAMLNQTEGQQGILGKLSDAVFGWLVFRTLACSTRY